jgi:hypothetical protein
VVGQDCAEVQVLLATLGDEQLAAQERGQRPDRLEAARRTFDDGDQRIAAAREQQLQQVGQRGQRHAVLAVDERPERVATTPGCGR